MATICFVAECQALQTRNNYDDLHRTCKRYRITRSHDLYGDYSGWSKWTDLSTGPRWTAPPDAAPANQEVIFFARFN
jgi:hypothetical protein